VYLRDHLLSRQERRTLSQYKSIPAAVNAKSKMFANEQAVVAITSFIGYSPAAAASANAGNAVPTENR
jgi:hypothetical protein